MSATEATLPRPLVLVVEDRSDSLELRLSLFRNAGCAAIGVPTSDDAIRELTASPQVDLVVTDIHLSQHADDDDRSGIALARYVRTAELGLPVAGYSGHFSEEALSSEELALFDRTFIRGSQRRRELEATINECKDLAVAHRQLRQEHHEENLALLRRRYELAVPTIDTLRRLTLGASPESSSDVDAALREAGYRLRLVETNAQGVVAEPFIVWLVDEIGGVEAEVYGQPALYGFGSNDDDAIEEVVELMALFLRDLDESSEDVSEQVRDMHRFLGRVLRRR